MHELPLTHTPINTLNRMQHITDGIEGAVELFRVRHSSPGIVRCIAGIDIFVDRSIACMHLTVLQERISVRCVCGV